MPPRETPHSVDPERLFERLDALPGIGPLREAAAGVPAYLVGGAVRDLLLGRDRTDVDVVVEGDPAEVAARLGGEARPHERFGTIAVLADGLEVDLATARTETYLHPGALPEVRPASLAEDLARRDFTVNAMAVPLAGGDLIDVRGGFDDLARGVLRTLHPSSMADDPTRALRAARYAARYGFGLDPQTEQQVRAADLATVSTDRVDAELRKLALEEAPRRGFELLGEWGLVELGPGGGDLVDSVASLLEDEPWAGFADRADAVLAAALGWGVEAARDLTATTPGSPSEAVERAGGAGEVTLVLARALGAEWLDHYLAEWRHVGLEIDGGDLLAAGVPEGPGLGRGLAAALRAKLDGEVEGRDGELRVALAAASEDEAS
jgi:tRNA nucleotidyltransferase (CCA-adding enzyme)